MLGTKKRACHAHQKSRIFKLLCLFLWRDNKFKKTQHVDADVFENGEKSIFFQTKTDACGRRLIFSLSVL